ncbi:MAG TPA: MFS transporter [Kofleriaceae bacterium]|jgi:MFS family permease
MARLYRALRHRNYRLFFIGQGISLVGTWLTRFATSWLAYKLTHSGTILGAVALFGQLPSALLSPLAGVVVDRLDRHRVIVVTQIAAGLQSAALAIFMFTGMMTVWHLLWLGAVQAVINAFDMPARQSFMGQMIDDKADLPNAIALNSSIVNGARLLGPMFAAALVALVGEAWCFTIDAASYIAVIISLLMMTVVKTPAPKLRSKHVGRDMLDGLRYAMTNPLLRSVLLLFAGISVLGGAYIVLMPLVAGSTLAGGPDTLGILMAAAGLGALIGALYLAYRETTVGLPNVIGYATTLLGLGLVALRFAPTVWIAAPIVLVCGLGWMVQMASTNTIIQSTVDSKMLGRVMSLYGVAFFAGYPVGAMLLGWIADQIGPMDTFFCAGIAVLVGAGAFRVVLPKINESVVPAARVA